MRVRHRKDEQVALQEADVEEIDDVNPVSEEVLLVAAVLDFAC